MEFKEIMEAFKEYGIWGTILGVIIILVWVILKSAWFGKLMTKIGDVFVDKFIKMKTKSKKSNDISITEADLLNHDIFNYIDFWIYSRIPTFNFSTDYRTIIFRKYLTVFLSQYKIDLMSYLLKKEFEEMSVQELWSGHLSLINGIIYDYEKEMISVGIPIIVIEKMKVKNNDTLSLTIDLIEGVCNSQFYKSEKNYLKIYSILNIILSILENTISNSEPICNSINGQLKGMKFTENGIDFIEP